MTAAISGSTRTQRRPDTSNIWKLIKRYYETRQDDAFWKEVVDSGVAISDKYNHHPLVDDFVRDAVMWLDKKSGNDKWWKEGTN